MSTLISFAESLRRYKLIENINDKRFDDDYKYKLFCDLFSVPPYIQSMKDDQDKLEKEKIKQLNSEMQGNKLLSYDPLFIKKIEKCENEIMPVEDIAQESLNIAREINRPKTSMSFKSSKYKPQQKHRYVTSNFSNNDNNEEIRKSPIRSSTGFKVPITSPKLRNRKSPRCKSAIVRSITPRNPSERCNKLYSPIPPNTKKSFTPDINVYGDFKRNNVFIPNFSNSTTPNYYQIHESGVVTARL